MGKSTWLVSVRFRLIDQLVCPVSHCVHRLLAGYVENYAW